MSTHVYSLLPVHQCPPNTVECLSTAGSYLLVGTKDAKVLFHSISSSSNHQQDGGQGAAVYTLSTHLKGSIRSIHPILSKELLLLVVGECIVLYRCSFTSGTPESLDRTVELARIAAGRDLVSVHVNVHKSNLSLAVLQSKRVLVYDWREAEEQWIQARVIALPDRAESCAMLLRSSMLIKQRYGCVIADLNTGAVESFSPPTTSRSSSSSSGSGVLLCDLHPVPECLWVEGGEGYRVLPDGEVAPGGSAVVFEKAPEAMSYEHPFLLSLHASRTQLEVRVPLLSNSSSSSSSGGSGEVEEDDAGGVESSVARTSPVLQTIHHSNPFKLLSSSSLYDIDRTTGRSLSPLGLMDNSGRLFVLHRSPFSKVVEELSTPGAPKEVEGLSVRLALLCPTEVDEKTKQRAYLCYLLQQLSLTPLKKTPLWFKSQMRESRIPALAWAALFWGKEVVDGTTLLSSEAEELLRSVAPSLLPKENGLPLDLVPSLVSLLREAVPSASPAEQDGLHSAILLSLLHLVATRPTGSVQQELHLFLKKEVSRDFLLSKAVSLLQRHHHWVCLTLVYERLEKHAEALTVLYRVAAGTADDGDGDGEGHSSPSTQRLVAYPITQPMCRAGKVLEEENLHLLWDAVDKGDDNLSDSDATFFERWRGVGEKSSEKKEGDCTASQALLLAVWYLRRLPLVTETKNGEATERFFSQHQSWILAAVPPVLSVGIYTTESKMREYLVSLGLLQQYQLATPPPTTKGDGKVNVPYAKEEVLVEYLFQLLSPHRPSPCTDPDIHNLCWRLAIPLLFPSSTTAVEDHEADTRYQARQTRYRPLLDQLLSRSPCISLDEVLTMLEKSPTWRKTCVQEREILYARLRRHSEAIEMLWEEVESNPMPRVKEYAMRCSTEYHDNEACVVLIRFLLSRLPEGDDAEREKGLSDLASILAPLTNPEAVLNLLPDLPDSIPLKEVCSFLKCGFHHSHTTLLELLSRNTVLEGMLALEQRTVMEAQRQSITVTENSSCAVCKKKIRPQISLAVYPDGTMVHEACVKEDTVCSSTGYRFNESLEMKLLQ